MVNIDTFFAWDKNREIDILRKIIWRKAPIGDAPLLDPVAIDQACVDLIYAAPDGASVVERIESRDGIHTIEHAETIGLGTREYNLVMID